MQDYSNPIKFLIQVNLISNEFINSGEHFFIQLLTFTCVMLLWPSGSKVVCIYYKVLNISKEL